MHLPGAAFINPGTELRERLTEEAARRALSITASGNEYTPVGRVVDERAIVNAIVGLLATGGSTNHTLHIVAIARAAGIVVDWDDFDTLSHAVPLLAHVYPSGEADVNQFHAAGGMALVIRELLDAELLHEDVLTVAGEGGLRRYTEEPWLAPIDGDAASRAPGAGSGTANGTAPGAAGGRASDAPADGDASRPPTTALAWREGPGASLDTSIIGTVETPFLADGGLRLMHGNLGRAVVKTSAVKPENRVVEAPARVFLSQGALKDAFDAGELEHDLVAVLPYQGPRANGMPELHKLTPVLGVLLDRGFKVALVTDGRMSGASGKVPAAIHVSPESVQGGPLSRVRDGDLIRVDTTTGELEALVDAADWDARTVVHPDLSRKTENMGRELFGAFREHVSTAETGAMSVFGTPSTAPAAPYTDTTPDAETSA